MNLEAVMVMAIGYEEHTSDSSWDADEMEVLAGAAKGYLFKLSFNGLLERLRHGQISQSRFDEEQDDLITWAWKEGM